jgi:carboxyl-terminal processing protease
MKMRFFLFGLVHAALVFGICRADQPTALITKPASGDVSSLSILRDLPLVPGKYTNTLTISPDAQDPEVARMVARLFERNHFTHHKVDDQISEKFFDLYLETLDPQRMYFLQPDFQEFVALRDQLDELTIRQGDTQPAYDMFNRFLHRADQQYAFVMAALRTNKFRFDADEKVTVNRKDAPRPKNLEEAQQLWFQRLRVEYLAEKLARPTVETTSSNVWTKASRWISHLKSTNPPTAMNLQTNVDSLIGTNRAPEFVSLVESKKISSVADVQKYLAGWFPAHEDEEIVQLLAKRYNRTLRNIKQIEQPEVLQFYLDSLARSFDPHSSYFDPRSAEAFRISMNLSLFGIGATLQSEDGYTVIRDVKAGSPADKSKQLKIGDKIIGVAQDGQPPVDVVEEKLARVVDMIRGAKDTKVTLTLIPAGADASKRKLVTLVRDEIKLEEAAAKAKLVELPAGEHTNRIGIIDLPSFYGNFGAAGRSGSGRSPTVDVAKLLRKLMAEKVDGVILDLRYNGGGLLEECVTLTGLFIKTGPVVQLKNPYGAIKLLEDDDPRVVYDGPLIVLTSRNSASASEILAGALQDYGRAIVVGEESTHGKGTAQHPLSLRNLVSGDAEGSEIKVTDNKFYRITGESTQLRGVIPDVILPSANVLVNLGEHSLSNALAWDTIDAANFDHQNRLQPILPELRHRSDDRVAQDRDFGWVREDMARYKKQLDDKTVSLSETVRRAELEADKKRAETRKQEIKARGEKEPVTYLITLKDVDNPGLPPAMTNKTVVAITNRDARIIKKEASQDPQSGADDEDEDAPPEDGIATDVHLHEAERILLDYVQLSAGKTPGTAKLP